MSGEALLFFADALDRCVPFQAKQKDLLLWFDLCCRVILWDEPELSLTTDRTGRINRMALRDKPCRFGIVLGRLKKGDAKRNAG